MGEQACHPLDPLLRPRSIAVLGASERADTVGQEIMTNLLQGGFEGPLYPVNPTREKVLGLRCFPGLEHLPETVDMVIFAIADSRVEKAIDETIAHGARAATIFSPLFLEEDTQPNLRERIAGKIRQSGLLVCGANGMGFYNFHDGIWACGFDTRHNHARGGNVTLISHSGSGMAGIIDCEERIDFNLVVSTGQELGIRMDQFMDFAIEQMDTRVIGLFMETARDPNSLSAVLEKAADRGIPVVALKVGRTELAARLTVSHSGALAGRDAAYQALFDRHGVQRVQDMDELTTALMLFAQPFPVGPGGLAGLHDSGGERQLLIDLADRVGVPLTRLSAESTSKLEQLLDPGLEAVNPLDAWSNGGENADRIMDECFAALMSDPGTSVGAVVHDRAPEGKIYPRYVGYLEEGHAASGKPVFLVSNHQGTGVDPLVIATTRRGFPVVDGLRPFLIGIRCLFAFRDFQLERSRFDTSAEVAPLPHTELTQAVEKWTARLRGPVSLDEHEAGELLADFGLPVNASISASSLDQALAAGEQLGYPVVLKSAQPGLHHKTELAGVVLNISGPAELEEHYHDMASRLGPQTLVCPMVARPGIEMILGVISDDQFGPLVIMGMGGVHAELMEDFACALPPFNAATARKATDKLKQRRLLDGYRGQPACDIDAYCDAAARLSVMVHFLRDKIDEVDINPIAVHAQGCTALDALVTLKSSAAATGNE